MSENVVKVSNKSASRVVYKIPEMNIRREFYPHEAAREVDVKELELLSQQPGGRNLIYHYLMIHDEKVLKHLINGNPAIEYWLTEDKIPTWMNTCSLEEFQDALDFAPEGTKDLIKDYAFKMPLNDYSKRQALLDQLGFDVTTALKKAEEIANEKDPDAQPAASAVVTSTVTAKATPTVRRSTSTTIVKSVE